MYIRCVNGNAKLLPLVQKTESDHDANGQDRFYCLLDVIFHRQNLVMGVETVDHRVNGAMCSHHNKSWSYFFTVVFLSDTFVVLKIYGYR